VALDIGPGNKRQALCQTNQAGINDVIKIAVHVIILSLKPPDLSSLSAFTCDQPGNVTIAGNPMFVSCAADGIITGKHSRRTGASSPPSLLPAGHSHGFAVKGSR
jgi:hypothetical protein